MSLRFQMLGPVPADTARLAKALSRKKPHPYIVFGDRLGDFLDCDDFTELYSNLGQSAIHPARLALALLVQFAEGLSDRQLADFIRWNPAVKYLLRLPLEHEGWDASVFTEFRSRLIAGGASHLIFNKLLEAAEELGLLNPEKQRTDSTYVLSAARELNTLELLHETMSCCLDELAEAAPKLMLAKGQPHWLQRYFEQGAFNYKLPKKEKARAKLATDFGEDMRYLLKVVDESAKATKLGQLETVRTLRRVFEEHFDDSNAKGGPKLRDRSELKPASDRIGSPHDVEARWAAKRGAFKFGYKAHFTETFSEGSPHLITHVETTASTMNDSISLPKIQEELKNTGRKPSLHLVDSGYVQVDYLHQSLAKDDIEILGPLVQGGSWQRKAGKGFDIANFVIDWENRTVSCPAGAKSESWKKGRGRNGAVVNVSFSDKECMKCPFREDCTTSSARQLQFKTQPVYEFAELLRVRQQTDEFKRRYAKRSGIEGTISQIVRRTDARRSRYVGLAKTAFANILSAAGLNFVRLANFFMDVPLARTRKGKYQNLLAIA